MYLTELNYIYFRFVLFHLVLTKTGAHQVGHKLIEFHLPLPLPPRAIVNIILMVQHHAQQIYIVSIIVQNALNEPYLPSLL